VGPSDLEPDPVRFPLRRGRAVVLHATGFRYPRGPRSSAEVFTSYADVTHLQLGSRTLRLATRRGIHTLTRRDFIEGDAPEHLVRALLQQIVRQPGGTALLARMAEVEETARGAAPLRATAVVMTACAFVFALQVWLGQRVFHAGLFNRFLVTHGESWRLLTASLLHGGRLHLAMNLLGLLVLGGMVERPLGTLRTAFIMGVAALGASAGALVAGYDSMVGASGIVAGLAGAMIWLEFRCPERLPATWRVPRRLFVGALVFDALLPLAVPVVAGAAHVGGFAAGLLATSLCAGRGLRRDPLPAAIGLAVVLLGAISVSSLVRAATFLVSGSAWQAHAERLLAAEDAPPVLMNDAAWLIATSPRPTPGALLGAEELAERAVDATGHSDPDLLDTLAEVQFRIGQRDSAVSTIDEAIALAPDETYFREQRRRFTGQRAADDRPEPPPFREPPPPRTPPQLPPEDQGVRV
jgi:membrane associated rhomboid family serine protease